MNLSAINKRVINLIINPKSEWELIKTENTSKNDVLRNYALPLVILMSICSVIGNSLYASRFLFSVVYLIFSGIAMFIVGMAGTYLSAIIINELTTSFNSKKETNLTFNSVIYSLTAFYIFTSLAYLLPAPFYQIRFFGFYSVYLFWLGSGSLHDTPTDNKVGFAFVSSLIVIGIYYLLTLIFNVIFNGFFAAGLVIK
jgi:hypothetical protein